MTGHCPACLSSEIAEAFSSVRKDYSLPGYAYKKCASCGSIYLDDPRVSSQDQLTDLHGAHWYDSGNFQFSREKTVSERVEAAVVNAASLIASLGLERGASILDIGCGNGELVAAFRSLDHDAWGIEPDAKAFGVLQTHPELADYLNPVGIEALIAGDNIQEALGPALTKGFDVVIMRDVLEHLFDPGQALTSIKQSIAAPGGLIYIEVPSGESLQLRFMREYAWSFMAPFHRTLFTREGMRRLAARCGLGDVELLPDTRKNWGWTRGAAYKSGFERQHEALRASEQGFSAYDYAIDDMLDEMSFALDAPPSITALMRV